MRSSHEHRERTVQIGLLAALAMVALVVAASSDSVRVWTNPEPSDAEPPDVVDSIEPTTQPTDEPTEGSRPGGIGSLFEIIGMGAFALIILLGVYASTQMKPSFQAWRRWLPRGRTERLAEPLPDAVEPEVRVDADAARVSLSEGPVRNAIVACWIQLEGDVAAAGLPRRAAETSSEYVERVIGASSVDAGPIRELAELYREARFSTHDLESEHRTRAAQALDRVLGALGQYDQASA